MDKALIPQIQVAKPHPTPRALGTRCSRSRREAVADVETVAALAHLSQLQPWMGALGETLVFTNNNCSFFLKPIQ